MDKKIVLYGADWCPDCHRSRDLLDSLKIEYIYLDIDSDINVKNKMLEITNGLNVIPTIILPDGQILQEPSNPDLLKALNLPEKSESADNQTVHDLVIVGAGPASLSAAVYTTRERIETVILEKGVIGGMAAVTDVIDNYPGFEDGVSGLELSEHLEKQAERFGAKIEFNEVKSIRLQPSGLKVVSLADEQQLVAKAVLIATGSDYRKANVPGEIEYLSKGVHYCATCDGAFYRDRKIAVIGGGNSAIQETLFLTRFASHIDLIVRSTLKASDVLLERINQLVDEGKITIYLDTVPISFNGDGKMINSLTIENNKTKKNSELEVDGIFVFVGLDPNSKFLKDSDVRLDDRGFVLTNDELETNIAGVFAAGDIRSGATMQIASAVGEGATAALKIRKYLED